MHLSAGSRYAIRILFELYRPGPPMAAAVLAEQTGISLKTVEKVQNALKKSGITGAQPGPGGGIFLLRPLTEVSLGQIVHIFEGGIHFVICCGKKGNPCPQQANCGLSAVWGRISQRLQADLNAISLWSILRQYPESTCSACTRNGAMSSRS